MKQIQKIILSLALISFIVVPQAKAEVVFPYAPGGKYYNYKEEAQETQNLQQKDKPLTVYELVNDSLRPEADEFYLSTIYGSSKDPRALIKRSNDIRAGELFTGTVEYKIGDKISDNYEIFDIDFRQREVIVRNIITNEYYALKLSYGTATSKLIKKYDYIPPKNK